MAQKKHNAEIINKRLLTKILLFSVCDCFIRQIAPESELSEYFLCKGNMYTKCFYLWKSI